jgi:hypothetical protein
LHTTKNKMEQELFSLITKLRDETSFINSEKKHLIELYKQVSLNFFANELQLLTVENLSFFSEQ